MLKSNTIRFATDTFGDALDFVDEELAPTTFTIVWKNDNGTVLQTQTVEAGTVPTYSGATPTKAETATETYTFHHWVPTPKEATADAVYVAVFTFETKTYAVNWRNEDGTLLEVDDHVTIGTVPTYNGATPTKAEDNTYTYTFSGWSPTPAPIAESMVYKATFTATLKQYTITWEGYDGTTLTTKTVDAGDTPTYSGATPTRPDDDVYTYAFKEWSPTPVPVFADTTYTAVYSSVEKEHPPETCTVVWKNYDGTILQTQTVEVGTVPTYSGATPTKPEDTEYTYTFREWGALGSNEQGPVDAFGRVYRAEYSATPKEYTATWEGYDGTVLLNIPDLNAGSVPFYPNNPPTRPDDDVYTYTFKEWSPTPKPIYVDTTFTPVFTPKMKHYRVTWKDYDGTVLLNIPDFNAGSVPFYPNNPPTRLDDDDYTYTFKEWSPTPDRLFADTTFTAVYSQVEKPKPVIPKQALLISKTPLDCTEKTSVSNFLIEGEEPTGSSRRVVFLIDDNYWIVKNNNLVAWNREPTFENVIRYGNRVSVLNEQTNITGFVGKKIYPIIALSAPYNADDFPTIKISLVTATSTSKLTNTQTSPVYEIADEAQTIAEIIDKTIIKGQATCTITVRLRNNTVTGEEEGEEETDKWSAYMTLAQAAGKQADAVQFKVKSVVTTTDGTDSVEVKSIAVSHSAGEAIVSGSTARLFSTVQNYELDLQTCYVVVRHEPLVDAVVEAYVNFMELPKHRELITIGTATGSRQELTLGLDGNADKNIVATSIKLYVDDTPLYKFDFSTELGTVIFTAKQGAVITASYDYDYGVEKWLEMNARVPQPYNDEGGTYASRFFLNLSHANTVGKKISNVMIRLRRLSGSATENLGVATGKKQLFTLKHKAKPSTITFTNTVDFSYDEESGILALVAAKGTVLNVSYSWQGENITVRSFAAGWIPTAGYDYQEGDYEYTIAGGGSSDYVLPTMAPNVKGGAKLGNTLVIIDHTLNVALGTTPLTLEGSIWLNVP